MDQERRSPIRQPELTNQHAIAWDSAEVGDAAVSVPLLTTLTRRHASHIGHSAVGHVIIGLFARRAVDLATVARSSITRICCTLGLHTKYTRGRGMQQDGSEDL